MNRSITLLERATENARYIDIAAAIGVGHSALANSKRVGHLSPLLAGQLALFLSEPVEKWMAVAALECAKPGKAKRMLEGHFSEVQKSSLSSEILSQHWKSWLSWFAQIFINNSSNNYETHTEIPRNLRLVVA